MNNDYELKITAEVNYGKELGRHRHTIEREDSDINIHEFLEILKSLTLAMGYAEENWKSAVVNMADEYMLDVREEELYDVELGIRGCPVMGHTITDKNQYSDFHGNTEQIKQEQC